MPLAVVPSHLNTIFRLSRNQQPKTFELVVFKELLSLKGERGIGALTLVLVSFQVAVFVLGAHSSYFGNVLACIGYNITIIL